MAGNRLVYWDSCLFIAWIKDEKRADPADMDGIEYLVEELEADRLYIATSTITRVEVLDSKLTPEQAAKFRAVLRRASIRVEPVNSPIADLAHEIRDAYSSPRLTTPDAIHIATAIATGCEALFTFDGASTKKKAKVRKIVPLGPKIMGKYPLVTALPRRPAKSQREFPYARKARQP